MNVEEHKPRILSVVNIFETGTPDGNYADISIFADGKGGTRQVTYGRSQTTEQGYLKDLVAAYVANGGTFSSELQDYLPRIGVTPLVDDSEFKSLLKRAGNEDPERVRQTLLSTIKEGCSDRRCAGQSRRVAVGGC